MIYTYTMFRKKIAVRLALFAAASAVLSCTIDPIPIDTCLGGECNAKMIFPNSMDENGYYHVKLDWTREYLPYFILGVEASPTVSELKYNNQSVVEARFDSDTSWVIGDTLVITLPLFKPFTGLQTQQGNTIPEQWIDLPLTQFEGIEVNVAQPTSIYFRQVGDKMVSRRVLGPFIPQMIGDTITVAMRVLWEAGDYTVVKDNYFEKFIVE